MLALVLLFKYLPVASSETCILFWIRRPGFHSIPVGLVKSQIWKVTWKLVLPLMTQVIKWLCY